MVKLFGKCAADGISALFTVERGKRHQQQQHQTLGHYDTYT